MNKHPLVHWICLILIVFFTNHLLISQDIPSSLKKFEPDNLWNEAKLDYYFDDGLSNEIDNGELILKGMNFMQSNMPTAALVQFKQWLKTNPSDLSVNLLVGISYVMASSFDSAIVYYEKAIAADPDNSEILCERAWVYFLKGDTLQCINEMARVYENDSNSVSVIYNYSKLKFETGFEQDAIRILMRVIDLRPDLSSTWFLLTSMYVDIGETEKAINCISNGLEMNNDNQYGYYERGLIYLDMGDEENAISDFMKAGLIDDLDSLTWNVLAISYVSIRYHKAAYYLKKVMITDDGPIDSVFFFGRWHSNEKYDLLNLIGSDSLMQEAQYPEVFDRILYELFLDNYDTAYYLTDNYLSENPEDIIAKRFLLLSQFYLEKYNDAEKTMDEIVFQDTTCTFVNFIKAIRSEDKNDFQSELFYTNRVIRSAPDYFEALTYNAWAKYTLHKFEDAILTISHAIELSPEEANPYNTRGLALNNLGRLEEAKIDFKNALIRNPRFCYALGNMAMVLIDLGQYDSASYYTRKAVTVCPDMASSYLQRGRLYIYYDMQKEAISDFTKAIELDPENPFYYMKRGSLYAGYYDYEKALLDFKKAIVLNPSIPGGYYEVTMTLINLKRNNEAKEFLLKAQKIFPNEVFIYNGLGYLYRLEYNNSESRKWFEMAVKIDPNNSFAFYYLGYIELVIGDFKLSNEYYQKAHRISSMQGSSNEEFIEMLQYLVRDGYKSEEAKRILSDVLGVK